MRSKLGSFVKAKRRLKLSETRLKGNWGRNSTRTISLCSKIELYREKSNPIWRRWEFSWGLSRRSSIELVIFTRKLWRISRQQSWKMICLGINWTSWSRSIIRRKSPTRTISPRLRLSLLIWNLSLRIIMRLRRKSMRQLRGWRNRRITTARTLIWRRFKWRLQLRRGEFSKRWTWLRGWLLNKKRWRKWKRCLGKSKTSWKRQMMS